LPWQLNLNLNYVSLVSAGLIYYLLGVVTYSPLMLGRHWRRLEGYDPADTTATNKPLALFVGMLGAQVNVFILAQALDFTQADSVSAALGVALFLWVGFYAAGRLSEAGHSREPLALALIHALPTLLGNIVAAIVLMLWPA